MSGVDMDVGMVDAEKSRFIEEIKPTVENELKAEEGDEFNESVQEIAWRLHKKKQKNKIQVAIGCVALIRAYGISTKEELQTVAESKEQFRNVLVAKVPKVKEQICDLIFDEFVVKAIVKKKIEEGEENEAKEFLTEAKERLEKRFGSDEEFIPEALFALIKSKIPSQEVLATLTAEGRESLFRLGFPIGAYKVLCPTSKRDNVENLVGPPLKKMRCLEKDLHLGKLAFAQSFPEDTGEEKGLKYFEFSENLFGKRNYGKRVIVRDCYSDIFEAVESAINVGNISLVMGTPGIGKTVFGIFAARELLLKEKTVVYQNTVFKEHAILLTKSDSEVMNAVRGRFGKEYEIQSHWDDFLAGIIVDNNILQYLLDHPDVYYILDPSNDGIVGEQPTCKVLIVSSPHRSNMNWWKSETLITYMPPWTWEEVELLNSTKVSPLHQQELQERFAKYGGIPRYVNAREGCEVAGRRYDHVLKEIEDDKIHTMLDPKASGVSKDINGMLVHMIPNEDYSTYTLALASNELVKTVFTKWVNAKKLQAEAFVSQLGKEFGTGFIREHIWLYSLVKGVENCMLRSLPPGEDSKPVTIPKFTGEDHFFSLDEVEFKVGILYHPPIMNFPTMDAFAILEKPFCAPEIKGECLVMFQMTTARKGHPLKTEGARRVREAYKKNTKKTLPYDHCFVVFVMGSEKQYNNLQKWKTDDGKEVAPNGDYSRIRQFVAPVPIGLEAFRKKVTKRLEDG